MPALTTKELLNAYAHGIFPMAENKRSRSIFWVDPEMRGIIPLETFHMPKRLARTVRQDVFEVRTNTCFDKVIEMCGTEAEDRPVNWINPTILRLYKELHRIGHAHSVESFKDGELVGGLYGVSLRGAFFGESMFSRARDASKVALCHLVAHLKLKGFTLLDTQFITAHLSQFGAIEIPRERYLGLLETSSFGSGSFGSVPNSLAGVEVLQSISQTS
jgi:leucyl/phenylalanyl-tRNA--protein transferase